MCFCVFQTNCVLIQSRELSMQSAQAAHVFGSDNYASAIGQGTFCSVMHLSEQYLISLIVAYLGQPGNKYFLIINKFSPLTI